MRQIWPPHFEMGGSWLRRPSRVGPVEGDLLAGSQDPDSLELFILTTRDFYGDKLLISKVPRHFSSQITLYNVNPIYSQVCGASCETKEMQVDWPLPGVQV